MFRRMLISCCVLCVALMQTGCFGLIVMAPQDCVRSGDSTSMAVANETPSTKEEVREFWGKPDEIIKVSESEESWIYNKKRPMGWFNTRSFSAGASYPPIVQWL
jgi:hypothetical protein